MKIVGVTGGSGAGKTVATKALASLGAEILDADVLAREVVMPGMPALYEIEKEWDGVVEEGVLDRRALAKIVFNDENELHKLNAITHKYIIDEINKRIKNSDAPIVVIDAIALFESGLFNMCDVTICVIADKNKRLERIMKRDNLTRLAAEERINAQKSDSFYIENADFTIYNNGNLAATEEEIGRIIKGSLLEKDS